MRFRSICLGTAALFAVGCADQGVVAPAGDPDFPILSQFAILDGANDGNANFFFLPPLVKNPNPTGIFNPNLLPTMDVCLITGGMPADAVCGDPVVSFGPGSAEVSTSSYAFNWDTDGPETTPLLPDGFDDNTKNYRIYISSANKVLGYLDVNPQEPSGNTPGQDLAGLYAFRDGEVIPVKFFIGLEENCTDASGYVIQCAASGIIDETGGTITLEPEQTGWSRLSVFVPADALPNCDPLDPSDLDCQVVMTIERIDPVLFAADPENFGTYCIPGLDGSGTFDAPLFGDCFRVTTEPELQGLLDFPALVEMCINLDPYVYTSLKFDEEQDTRLQIIAYHDQTEKVEGLENAYATTCGAPALPPPSQLGLLPVPEKGLLRYAAIGVNSVARLLGPTPVAAHGEIRLAGATSEFSRFMWGLPGQMTKEAGDGTVIQSSLPNPDYDVTVQVKVVDSGVLPGTLIPATPSAVEGATVHFSDDNGFSADVVTDENGIAEVTWTVPEFAGDHVLNATALGLLAATVPDHDESIDFTEETVSFTATVVGAPAALNPTPSTYTWATVTAGGTASWTNDGGATSSSLFGITVVDDQDPANPVEGATVSWVASLVDSNGNVLEECGSGTGVTGPGGIWTGTWPLCQTVGTNTLTVTVGALDTSWSVTSEPGVPASIAIAPASIVSPVVGSTHPMTATVKDQYGNVIDPGNYSVTWTTSDAPSLTTGFDASSWVAGSWTLSTEADVVSTLTAVVDGYPTVTTSVPATTVADAADKVVAVSGTGQSGPVNTALAQPLVVQVTDQYGNVTPSQAVSWSASGGSEVTNATPYIWTLGATPNTQYTATASVGGSQDATFTATSRCVVNVNGIIAESEWVCAVASGDVAKFTANISGGTADAWVYWQNDADNLYLAVKVMQADPNKANSVRFDFDRGTGFSAGGPQKDSVHSANDDAIGVTINKGEATFYDQYLTAKCANSSQSGCGALDKVQDGQGKFDPTPVGYITYELSHPLRALPGQPQQPEDFNLAAGDLLGFFITLQNGNGAQGNTQWPGFRQFKQITIR